MKVWLILFLCLLTQASFDPVVGASPDQVDVAPSPVVSNPILFIHGMGNRKKWDHVHAFMHYELKKKFGGVLLSQKAGQKDFYDASGDYFLLRFIKNEGALAEHVEEIKEAVDRIYQNKKIPVRLIGFSYGGVSSRAYLIKYPENHHVKQLITFHSPHLGTHWAYLWPTVESVKKALNECSYRLFSKIDIEIICEKSRDGIYNAEAFSRGTFDSPAIKDLYPPVYGRDADGKKTPLNLIATMAHSPHPLDVDYVAVIGQAHYEKSLVKALDRTSDTLSGVLKGDDPGTFRFETVQYLLKIRSQMTGESFEETDGGVTVYSQNLINLPWFLERTVSEDSQPWGKDQLDTYTLHPTGQIRIIRSEDDHSMATLNFRILGHLIMER